jgi:hypothetical protein
MLQGASKFAYIDYENSNFKVHSRFFLQTLNFIEKWKTKSLEYELKSYNFLLANTQ